MSGIIGVLQNTIFTVGHSTHPLDRFLSLLAKHGITAVCDVRSSPYSRMNPQFNRETLKAALKEAGIAYVFLGDELGARSKDPACNRDGKVSYELLAKTATFSEGIERVKKGAEQFTVALMCAEKDPLQCHRMILVARNLAKEGYEIRHILADGRIESQPEAEARLLAETKVPENDLFLSESELLDRAYRQREGKIAYEEAEREEPPRDEAASL